MAIQADAARPIVIGNDHRVKCIDVVDEDGVLIDMSSWTLVKWYLREKDRSTAPLLEKTATRAGTYNIVAGSNTQHWYADLSDDETLLLTEGDRFFSWKRMDAGYESDLAYGKQEVRRTASR